jgi:aspartate carbamoyltransferase regulatory subunit
MRWGQVEQITAGVIVTLISAQIGVNLLYLRILSRQQTVLTILMREHRQNHGGDRITVTQ